MTGTSLIGDPIEDNLRARMMETAARYLFYSWNASYDKHKRHDDEVDTPDRDTQYFSVFEDWWGWGDEGNCGVPYFWLGDAGLDPEQGDYLSTINSQTGEKEKTFDEVIRDGYDKDKKGRPLYDAGDISTEGVVKDFIITPALTALA